MSYQVKKDSPSLDRKRFYALLIGTLLFAFSAPSARASVATASPTISAGSCTNLFNNADSLTVNGTWSGASATRTLVTSAPPGAITQGSGAIDVNITAPSTSNTTWAVLTGFTPADWTPYQAIRVDMYFDPGVWGNGFREMYLYVNGGCQVSSGVLTPSDGPNTLTWWLDNPGGCNLSAISSLAFEIHTDVAGPGHVYIDNMRLLRQSCGFTVTFSPTQSRTYTVSATPTATPTIGSHTATATKTPTSPPGICGPTHAGVSYDTVDQYFSWTGQGGYVVSGYNCTGNAVTVTGIPPGSNIIKAYLYQLRDLSAPVSNFSSCPTTMLFAGSPITGSIAGVAYTWEEYCNTRYDVSSLMVPGINGTYTVGNPPGGSCQSNTIVVVYENLNDPYQTTVTLDDGLNLWHSRNSVVEDGRGPQPQYFNWACGANPVCSPPIVGFTRVGGNGSNGTGDHWDSLLNGAFAPVWVSPATGVLNVDDGDFNSPRNDIDSYDVSSAFTPGSAAATYALGWTDTSKTTWWLAESVLMTKCPLPSASCTAFVTIAPQAANGVLWEGTSTNALTTPMSVLGCDGLSATGKNYSSQHWSFSDTGAPPASGVVRATLYITSNLTNTSSLQVDYSTDGTTNGLKDPDWLLPGIGATQTQSQLLCSVLSGCTTSDMDALELYMRITGANVVMNIDCAYVVVEYITSCGTSTFTPTYTRTFTQTPSPSMSPSPSQTPTWTWTFTHTFSPTQSFTLTQTPTWTNSRTPTPSPTVTFTATPTPTWTTTYTYTFSPTKSFTATPTPTWTVTFTYTNSPTRSFTATETPTKTNTATPTFSASPTPTFTPTPTWTVSYTYTFSPSRSFTASQTPTWTPSVTYTDSPTRSFTATVTPTFTASATPTYSVSITDTPTVTHTSTNTYTHTQFPSKTGTDTITVTFTPSATPTFSASPTPTDTVTVTFSASDSPTYSASPTPTYTVTDTDTVTDTPTATFTPTPTFTASATPTFSASPTPTFTASDSPTASATPTSTFTATPSFTASASPTYSASPTPTPTDSPTSTATSTATSTSTDSPSRTDTATGTGTFTPTPTATYSGTATSSATSSDTLTPSATRTSTLTPSPTHTPPGTPTNSPSWTPTSPPGVLVKVYVYNEAGEIVGVIDDGSYFDGPVEEFLFGGGENTLTDDQPELALIFPADGTQQAVTLLWDGLGLDGKPLANGAYIIKVESVDSLGITTVITGSASILRSPSTVTVKVFNEAGELVWTVVKTGVAADQGDVKFQGNTINTGLSPSDPGGSVQVILGPAGTVIWTGVDSQGQPLANGSYIIEVDVSLDGKTTAITETVTLLSSPAAPGLPVINPNPVAGGKPVEIRGSTASRSAVIGLEVQVYTVSGEMIRSLEAPSDSLFWDLKVSGGTPASAGLYLLLVETRTADGNSSRTVSRLVVLR